MVIQDGDFGWALRGPTKNDAPLIIDTDGMAAIEVTGKRLQAVARWHGEVRKLRSLIHLNEFAQRNATNSRETPIPFGPEKLFRIGIGKRLDHIPSLFRNTRVSKHRLQKRGGAAGGVVGDLFGGALGY
jgi:hypothetical protein